MKKYLIALSLSLSMQPIYLAYADSDDIGLSTAIVTIAPFYSTFYLSDQGTQGTKTEPERDNSKTEQANQEAEYKRKVFQQATDDAMTFIATDGLEGKTVRFEAAAKEVRKTDSSATDYDVAKAILYIR